MVLYNKILHRNNNTNLLYAIISEKKEKIISGKIIH